jgi:hypothetical protein
MQNAEFRMQKSERKKKLIPTWALILTSSFIIHHSSLPAQATPTQEDVFKSIQSNVHSDPVDGTKVLGFLFAFAGVVVLIVAINKYQKPSETVKTLNHQGKLIRELMKNAGLKSSQIRQLKALRDDLETRGKPVEHLVTLLLCPSLIKTAREPARDKKRPRP